MRPALSASSRSVTIRPLLAIIATSLRRQRPPGRGLVSSRAAGLARATGMPRSWCGASRWWDHKASDAPAGPIGVTGSPAGWGGHAPLHRLAHSIALLRSISAVSTASAGPPARSLLGLPATPSNACRRAQRRCANVVAWRRPVPATGLPLLGRRRRRRRRRCRRSLLCLLAHPQASAPLLSVGSASPQRQQQQQRTWRQWCSEGRRRWVRWPATSAASHLRLPRAMWWMK